MNSLPRESSTEWNQGRKRFRSVHILLACVIFRNSDIVLISLYHSNFFLKVCFYVFLTNYFFVHIFYDIAKNKENSKQITISKNRNEEQLSTNN